MKCTPRRMNDQMQCHCGMAWDIGEEKPECKSTNTAVIAIEWSPASVEQFTSRMNRDTKTHLHCNNCGERFIGDGYKTPMHCPDACSDGFEPDCNPIECKTVIEQNEIRELVKHSPCTKPEHRFCDNECIYCGVKRPMLLNSKGNRSIFDDVDE